MGNEKMTFELTRKQAYQVGIALVQVQLNAIEENNMKFAEDIQKAAILFVEGVANFEVKNKLEELDTAVLLYANDQGPSI